VPKQPEPPHWDTLSTETALLPAAADSAPGDGERPGSGEKEPHAGGFPPATFANFRIIRLLGRGGMGQVYLAQDTSIDRLVAIKFIRKPGERQRARFRNEARAAGKLDHPNIVKIFQFDEVKGQPYIVAEYVDGESLGACPRPMPWQEALALGLGMASGLADAHRRGVLHRDIKPSNVIIARSGQPKLLDFGLAKLQDAAGARAETAEPAAADAPAAEVRAHTTEAGAILGTPYYMAPEAWRGESSCAADVYSLGVVLYELCTGYVPFHDVARDQLRQVLQERDPPRLAAVAPQVPFDLAQVVERCLARDPDQRFESGERLLAALLAVDAPAARTSAQWPARARDTAEERPYPGLRPFDAADGRYFFGRDEDTGRVVARLRNAGMVLVAGSSGVGKSSLVRAGVLPYLVARGLDETGAGERGWELRAWMPGMHPLQAMGAALRADLDLDEDALSELLAHDPAEVGRRLQRRVRTGVVLFVDQLEELVTVAGAEEAALASRALATLAARFPRLRVLATVRGDKLIEVGSLPGLDALIERALYILQPLGERQVRDAVVRPAERCGIRFESEAMVATLVRDSISQAGGLPLLQSALALLWDGRDQARGIIPGSALADIGGVAGALSQQADRVLDALLPETRAAARTILLRLVTLHGARVRYGAEDLVGGPAHEAALAALVAGRLLVAREIDGRPVYELAHDALVHAWPTLRAWLAEEDRLLQVRQRLARAAEEWERQGRPREMLWQGRRLRELDDLPVEALVAREQGFVRESGRLQRRTQRRRLLALALVPCLLAALYGWSRLARAREIQKYLDAAMATLAEASRLEAGYAALRRDALVRFAAFDATRPGADQASLQQAEELWRRAVHEAPEVDRKLLEATRPLELALLLDPTHTEVRRLLGGALHGRALLAEDQGHLGELAVLRERLAVYDAELAARWQHPGRVVVATWPAGLAVELYEYEPDAAGALALTPRGALAAAPATASLLPGSYLAVVPAHGQHAEVRHPFWLAPGRNLAAEPLALRIVVPAAAEVPAELVYVSAGWYWSGFGGDEVREPIREWQLSAPPHERWTGGFFIARHETTYAQWIEFLRALPPEERTARMPRAELYGAMVELADVAGELAFRYRVESGQEPYTARVGERVRYPQRTRRQEQDWLRFPVTGIDGEDIAAYTRWLADRGVVPGARMCREDEWERAARGADLRVYPHGDRLAEDDANIDATYGRKSGAYGLDEVGSHPRSRSPFGLDDMMGNVRELTVSILEPGKLALRSGSFFNARPTNLVANRDVQIATQRNPHVGFRICADAPLHLRGAQ
jgi:formylglycine-generating enzyme required for sulfatase activity